MKKKNSNRKGIFENYFICLNFCWRRGDHRNVDFETLLTNREKK